MEVVVRRVEKTGLGILSFALVALFVRVARENVVFK